MASLREIKDRISSVKSTLKITSAMKLVASSKLRKAQKEIESLRPYEQTLDEILDEVALKAPSACQSVSKNDSAPVAIVAVASNNSLCGAFNVGAVKKLEEYISSLNGRSYKLFCIGRKMSEAAKSMGITPEFVSTELVAHPSFERSSELSRRLISGFACGEISEVVLIYNKFISTSSQKPVTEQYLPYSREGLNRTSGDAESSDDSDSTWDAVRYNEERKYIYEPDAFQIASTLMPQLLNLKFHAAILDSVAAEHAARTIAMQTATDNAQNLLADLTLEYNKGRQQKITSEILDLVGGSTL